MRPNPPLVLQAALKTLEEVALGQTDEQVLARLHGVSTLLSILQREWDTCASNLLDGIARYGDIVRRGSLLADGDRRERLRRALDAVADGSSDFRISALEIKLDQLRGAVIELQAWLEDEEGPTARALLADLWQAEHEDALTEDRNTPLW
jgi:hypothetical protein